MVTKEIILTKALKLFNESGYLEVGMRDLARHLGISPGNLTYHFSKKEDVLLALLTHFTQRNDSLYEQYFASEPNLAGFLTLMKKVFETQYDFRGVFIGNQFVRSEIIDRKRFDYQSITSKREGIFQRIFHDLDNAKQIRTRPEDTGFLVSFIRLFGRFWLSEATLFEKSPDKSQTISTYMDLLSFQISLFATEKGHKSIENFKKYSP